MTRRESEGEAQTLLRDSEEHLAYKFTVRVREDLQDRIATALDAARQSVATPADAGAVAARLRSALVQARVHVPGWAKELHAEIETALTERAG